MLRVCKPPEPVQAQGPTLFLAGSIEMGQAQDWQSLVIGAFAEVPIVILNPRRDEWDASWEQSIHFPLFREQVEWELAGLEQADLIAMYFAPATRSPITLLELGLFAQSGKLLVCCPDGFWRKGNVEVVCNRYGVPLRDSLEDLIAAVKDRLGIARA